MIRVSSPYVSTGAFIVFQMCVLTSQCSPGYDRPADVYLNTLWLQDLILFLICVVAFIFWLMFTPRIVVSSDKLIDSPSRSQVGGSLRSAFPILVHLVFVGLNLVLHVFAYVSQVSMSSWSPVDVVLNKLISSAYAKTFNLKL